MEIESYEADFLIACDGANSTVRKWTGIGFDGFTYPEKFQEMHTLMPHQTTAIPITLRG